MDKIRKFLIYGVIIILLIYSFMTDKGAVRFSVFISGYPKEAITGSLILDKSHKLKSNQKAYIIKKPTYKTGGINFLIDDVILYEDDKSSNNVYIMERIK